MPHIVGLTGGIGSGKSSVSNIWRLEGVAIIDADAIARSVVQPGRPALLLIRLAFGQKVLCPDGTLDRRALGELIFGNADARRKLNRITHPFIVWEMILRMLWLAFVRWKKVVVLDTPLLYETKNLRIFCGSVVVVYCKEAQQIERVVRRSNGEISVDEARKRVQAQMSLEEKAKLADFVIDNSQSKDELRGKALEVLQELQPSPVHDCLFRCSTIMCVLTTVSLIGGVLCRKLIGR